MLCSPVKYWRSVRPSRLESLRLFVNDSIAVGVCNVLNFLLNLNPKNSSSPDNIPNMFLIPHAE